jgi:hypothetical protein
LHTLARLSFCADHSPCRAGTVELSKGVVSYNYKVEEGYFFWHLFFLAAGFWLLAFEEKLRETLENF